MSIFQFKQFAVNQTGCAMKVNTDGVLLGALADADEPDTILDIGTGTGVIALMLAQRFPSATIDAVEIDEAAAATALQNFNLSPFFNRLSLYHASFQDLLKSEPDKKYNLILSNPPFHLNSLKSTGKEKAMARHTGEDFFLELISITAKHLTANGRLTLVLPYQAALLAKTLAENAGLSLQNVIQIRSYPQSEPHREIITFGFSNREVEITDFTIYNSPKSYSAQYRTVLSSFLTIF